MKSCNRGIVSVLVFSAFVAACDVQQDSPSDGVDAAMVTTSQAVLAAPVTISIPSNTLLYQSLGDQAGHVFEQFPISLWEPSGFQRKLVADFPIAGIPIGATLINVTVSIKDTPQDGCFFAFYDQFHGEFRDASGAVLPMWAPEAAFSVATHAMGAWEQVSMQQPFNWSIQSGHVYSVVVHFGHMGPCWIEAIEVTYIPPA